MGQAAGGILDLMLVAVALSGAGGYLVWHVGLRRRRPSCHRGPAAPESRNGTATGGDVVLGPGLARALARAESRVRAPGRA